MQTEVKLTDLEGHSRRDNVRIFGVKEGAEENMATMITFVEDLLMKGLQLSTSTALNIERAHRVLTMKPPSETPTRSIVVKFMSFKMKDEVLEIAWQRKGFDFQGMRIHLDHDYAPEITRVLQGRHGDLQLSRGGDGRYGREGYTTDSSETSNFTSGPDQPAVMAIQR